MIAALADLEFGVYDSFPDVNVNSKEATVTVTRYLGEKETFTVTCYFFEMSNKYALRDGVTRYPLLADFLPIHSVEVGLREKYASSMQ